MQRPHQRSGVLRAASASTGPVKAAVEVAARTGARAQHAGGMAGQGAGSFDMAPFSPMASCASFLFFGHVAQTSRKNSGIGIVLNGCAARHPRERLTKEHMQSKRRAPNQQPTTLLSTIGNGTHGEFCALLYHLSRASCVCETDLEAKGGFQSMRGVGDRAVAALGYYQRAERHRHMACHGMRLLCSAS